MLGICKSQEVCLGNRIRYARQLLIRRRFYNMAFRIALDAGHSASSFDRSGGKGVVYDDGQVFEEHTFNAEVVRYAAELAKYNGIEVIITQPLHEELEVNLNDRVSTAVSNGADLLMSFHADANPNPAASGHWVFHWYSHLPSKRLAELWDMYADEHLPHQDRGGVESRQNEW